MANHHPARCCHLLATLAVLAGAVAQEQEPKCPFPAPSLSSARPAEVAWAAAGLTKDSINAPATLAELRAAMLRMVEGGTDEHRLALLHLLDTAVTHGAALAPAALQFDPGRDARVPWLVLQTRATTGDGRSLFALFRGLDEATDLGWEYVGDELAKRGHRTFAVELRTSTKPVLHVCAGHADRGSQPLVFMLLGDAPPDPGWPLVPRYHWLRDGFGMLTTSVYRGADYAPEPAKPTPSTNERARLRWLAQIAGESRSWVDRFEVHYPRRNLAGFAEFSAVAEQKAREALAELDAALRADLKLPERLALPGLEVVWDDNRPDELKTKEPFPERPAR